ncbi:unnamed protein product [Calypogeia fissa]
MLRQLLQSSIQATRRALAWNVKDISPPAEVILFNFAKQDDVKLWEVYADSKHGGLSSATLDVTRKHRNTAGIFSGSLSENVAADKPVTLKRSGFVGIRTMEDRYRIDLEPFQALLFRVKGDGRCYISSLRTESWVTGPTDGGFNTWQAFLFAPKDEWSTVEIPLSRYLPTWRGKILPVDHEMNLRSVLGLGLSTTVEGPEEAIKGPGDFRLEIQWIKAIQKTSLKRL